MGKKRPLPPFPLLVADDVMLTVVLVVTIAAMVPFVFLWHQYYVALGIIIIGTLCWVAARIIENYRHYTGADLIPRQIAVTAILRWGALFICLGALIYYYYAGIRHQQVMAPRTSAITTTLPRRVHGNSAQGSRGASTTWNHWELVSRAVGISPLEKPFDVRC